MEVCPLGESVVSKICVVKVVIENRGLEVV